MSKHTKLKKIYLLFALGLIVQSAYAGCENYSDAPIEKRPIYLFCISKENCSLQYLLASCSNFTESFDDFGGLLVRENYKNGRVIKREALFMDKLITNHFELFSCSDNPKQCSRIKN